MLRADLLERRQLHREAEHALGQVLRRALVDPHHGLGRVAGLGERVQHLADALALGVDDVERSGRRGSALWAMWSTAAAT